MLDVVLRQLMKNFSFRYISTLSEVKYIHIFLCSLSYIGLLCHKMWAVLRSVI
jgi:ABC-type siderophore export system fused ATPase/permease subunit